MKNEMERLRGQVEDLKAEVINLQKELKASQLKSAVPQDADTHLVSEKALHDSDERYQNLFENMLNGFAYCRMLFENGLPKDFIYLNVNKAFETLTGLKNVVGKKVSEAIPGIQDFDPEVLEIYGRVSLTGKPERFEIYVKALSDWFAVSVYSPRKEYFVAVFDVITERKQAEKALRESEERFKLAIEATNDGLWDWNVKTDGGYFSPNYYRILGYEPGDFPMEGNTWKDLIHPDDREHALRVNMDCIEGRRDLFEVEYRMKAKSGEWRWILGRGKCLARDEQGRALRLLGTHVNITERKLAEEALRESEERFRLITETIDEVFWMADVEIGRIFYVSPGFERIWRRTRQSLYNNPRSFLDTVHVEDRDRVLAGFEIKKTGQPFSTEYRIILADGNIRHIWDRGFPIRDEKGQVSIYAGIAMDITDRKRAEEHIRYLQKAESLSRMAGAIAHHFNNQLGTVMGNLELAMATLPLCTGPVENLTEAIHATRRAAKVSGLMLTYLGQTPGKREPLDLSEICHRSLPMLHASIPKNVALETDLPSPGPTISANANQIQQVLTNICTNAWEAFGDGRGDIHLIVKTISSTDIPSAPHFPLGWHPEDTSYACLEVADTGCGIEAKDIDKLFDPFFSSKFTGRGLGLPVVLGIVRTHGGVITVQSEPGHGSVFRVFFPVSKEEAPRQPEKVASASEIKGGGTVLLVEDDELLRKTNATVLAHLGYSVLSARDGVEAVEVFRQRQKDIRFVLCDLTMPRMDGWKTLAALRELSPGIPVILTSGFNEAQAMVRDHPTLPDAFLSKPFVRKELIAAIGQALSVKN